jgi:hypothetical protein
VSRYRTPSSSRRNPAPSPYRLPLLVLDATGMRLGELEGLRWGDVDEPRGRWRVSKAVARPARGDGSAPTLRSSRPCSSCVPETTAPPTGRCSRGSVATGSAPPVSRACIAAGVPTFSPHDLRHRRISLLHLAGTPWARIGEHVGQRNLAVTATRIPTFWPTRPSSTTACSFMPGRVGVMLPPREQTSRLAALSDSCGAHPIPCRCADLAQRCGVRCASRDGFARGVPSPVHPRAAGRR